MDAGVCVGVGFFRNAATGRLSMLQWIAPPPSMHIQAALRGVSGFKMECMTSEGKVVGVYGRSWRGGSLGKLDQYTLYPSMNFSRSKTFRIDTITQCGI